MIELVRASNLRVGDHLWRDCERRRVTKTTPHYGAIGVTLDDGTYFEMPYNRMLDVDR